MASNHPSPDFISIPILKFSFSDDHGETDKSSWKHLTQELIVVFDVSKPSTPGPRHHMMKVFQGTRVLEELNVEELIFKSEEVVDTMRKLGIEVRADQLPITGLVRKPLIAIKYNKGPNYVRRMQLKFASGNEFDIAFNHLNKLGLRMSQSPPAGTSAQSTTSDTSLPESRPTTASSATMPSLPQQSAPPTLPHSASFSGGAVPHPNFHEQHTSVSVGQSHLTGSGEPQPASSSFLSEQGYHFSSASRPSTALPNPTVVDISTAPRPASAYATSVNETHTTQQAPVQWPIHNLARGWELPQSTAFSAPGPTALTRAAIEPRASLPTIREDDINGTGNTPSLTSVNSTPAPPSIPPRRELPFKRPIPPKSSGTDNPSSTRPSSATTSFRQVTVSKSKRCNSLRDLPPLPHPTLLSGATAPSPSIPEPLHSVNNGATGVQGQPSHIPHQHNPPRQPESSGPTAGMGPPTHLDRVVSQIHADGQTAREELTKYATQSSEDRAAILNDFVVQHIEDDSFLALCEDVEACWRRACLHLDD